MGAQAILGQASRISHLLRPPRPTSSWQAMAPMKTMKGAANKAMTRGAMAKQLAGEHSLKQKQASDLINSIAALGTKEVKRCGVFSVPGLCRIKTRVKPATKAGTRVAFGKEIKVKAKPARTIVKAFPVAALKKSI